MRLPHPSFLVVFFFLKEDYFSGGGLVAKLCPTLATPWTV